MLRNRVADEEFARHVSFFTHIEVVQALLHAKTVGILQAIDETIEHAPSVFLQFTQTPEDRHVIRLLEYIYTEGAPETAPMANLHTDQSLFTLQWFQSHPGLVLRDYKGNNISYDYVPGSVICFFGKKILPATNGLLKPVEHWVDSRAHENRYSGIYFTHTPHPSIEMDRK